MDANIYFDIFQKLCILISAYFVYTEISKYLNEKKINEVRYDIEEAIKFKLSCEILDEDFILNNNHDNIDRMLSRLNTSELLKMIGGYSGIMNVNNVKAALRDNEEWAITKYGHMKKYI